MGDSKAEFEFIDFAKRSRAPRPADDQKTGHAAAVSTRSARVYQIHSKPRATSALRDPWHWFWLGVIGAAYAATVILTALLIAWVWPK